MLESNKRLYKIGDIVTYKHDEMLVGIIIGYHFPCGYNNYVPHFGYTVKILTNNCTSFRGHPIGNNTYTANGNLIKNRTNNDYWWIRHYETRLIHRNISFLLKL